MRTVFFEIDDVLYQSRYGCEFVHYFLASKEARHARIDHGAA